MVKKKTACNAGDPGPTPGLGRSPGEGNGIPLQYPCLGNWTEKPGQGYSLWNCKESDTTEWQTYFTWGKQPPSGELEAILLKGEDAWRERHWRTRQNESREATDRWGKPSWIFQPSWWVSWMLLLEWRSQCHMGSVFTLSPAQIPDPERHEQ